MKIKDFIFDIKDFPKPGVTFKDITPLLANGKVFAFTIDLFVKHIKKCYPKATKIVGMESRGFMFATTIAKELGIGFIPIRKPNKLPRPIYKVEFNTEYSKEEFNIHQEDLNKNDNVIIVDDVLATGGTAKASVEIVEKTGATVFALLFLIELEFLNGRDQIKEKRIHSLVKY